MNNFTEVAQTMAEGNLEEADNLMCVWLECRFFMHLTLMTEGFTAFTEDELWAAQYTFFGLCVSVADSMITPEQVLFQTACLSDEENEHPSPSLYAKVVMLSTQEQAWFWATIYLYYEMRKAMTLR